MKERLSVLVPVRIGTDPDWDALLRSATWSALQKAADAEFLSIADAARADLPPTFAEVFAVGDFRCLRYEFLGTPRD